MYGIYEIKIKGLFKRFYRPKMIDSTFRKEQADALVNYYQFYNKNKKIYYKEIK